MNDYRTDSRTRCEACGAGGGPLDYGDDGRLLCRTCAARATVKSLEEQQAEEQRLEEMIDAAHGVVEHAVDKAIDKQDRATRRCPTCGPTMVGSQQRNVGAPSLGNVSGVTYDGKFTCTKCGRKVSIFPFAPAILRAVLVVGGVIAVSRMRPPLAYVVGSVVAVFFLFALADFIQRLRYPIVKR